MRWPCRVLVCVMLAAATPCARSLFAQTVAPGAADPQAIWNALARPAFDAKSANVNNLVIQRDRIRVTFDSGTLQFSQPINGIVTAAVFRGTGRLQVSVPDGRESQQLDLFLKTDGINLPFTEAALTFTDKTFDEISPKVQLSGTGSDAEGFYAARIEQNEDLGASFLPRLFKSATSTDRAKGALFLADVKSDEFGWVEALYDASDPEEVSVGRWQEMFAGYKNFDIWTSFPAGNRSASSSFDKPFEKADYVIRSYDMDVTVTARAELAATAKVNLEAQWAGEHTLLFDLDSNLRIDKISDAGGKPLAFFQARERKDRPQSYGAYVAVVLPAPAQAGQPLTLSFHYAGKRVVREVGAGNYFAESFGWYPSRMAQDGVDFAGRFDFDLHFRSPKKFSLVATGNKVSETTDGSDLVTEWKNDAPLTVAGFAFGDYKISTEKVGPIEVQVFANRSADDQMQMVQNAVDGALPGSRPAEMAVGTLSAVALAPTIAAEMGNALRLFQKYYGPYPYKQLAVTNIPYSYGQGWPGLIYLSIFTFMDDTQRNAFHIRNDPRGKEFFRAHETSHQWWGHRVAWKSYHDQWLSEGFAQFSGNLYVQFRDSQKEYIQRLRDDRQQLLTRDAREHVYDSIGPIWMGTRTASSISPGAYNILIYNKGGYVLTMLRMMMADSKAADPDARFEAMMQNFCNTYNNSAASTEDFKAVAEKYMTPFMDLEGNHRLDWFFRQYVYGTGIPRYEFHYSLQDAGGGKFKLSGSLKRSGVPANWMDIVPIFGENNGKPARLGLLRVTQADYPLDVTLPSNPGKIELNSNEELLAEIKQ